MQGRRRRRLRGGGGEAVVVVICFNSMGLTMYASGRMTPTLTTTSASMYETEKK